MPLRRYWLSVCRSTRHGRLSDFEGRDRGHQLHAVVGGVGLATLELLDVIAGCEDRAPAAGPGIARAGPVGMNDHVRFAHDLSLTMCCRIFGRKTGFHPRLREGMLFQGCFGFIRRSRSRARWRRPDGNAACGNIPAGPCGAPARSARRTSRPAASAETAAQRRAPASAAPASRAAKAPAPPRRPAAGSGPWSRCRNDRARSTRH